MRWLRVVAVVVAGQKQRAGTRVGIGRCGDKRKKKGAGLLLSGTMMRGGGLQVGYEKKRRRGGAEALAFIFVCFLVLFCG